MSLRLTWTTALLAVLLSSGLFGVRCDAAALSSKGDGVFVLGHSVDLRDPFAVAFAIQVGPILTGASWHMVVDDDPSASVHFHDSPVVGQAVRTVQINRPAFQGLRETKTAAHYRATILRATPPWAFAYPSARSCVMPNIRWDMWGPTHSQSALPIICSAISRKASRVAVVIGVSPGSRPASLPFDEERITQAIRIVNTESTVPVRFLKRKRNLSNV